MWGGWQRSDERILVNYGCTFVAMVAVAHIPVVAMVAVAHIPVVAMVAVVHIPVVAMVAAVVHIPVTR